MFKHALVRTPGPNIAQGITTANLGQPIYQEALRQHAAYIAALEACGVQVHVMEPAPDYPDACFVEDTAVLAERVAIITNPGAPTRKGEQQSVAEALCAFYPPDQIAGIHAPGTLEGGDVMRVGDHFYVGLSERTNAEGAAQFIALLNQYGYSGSMVEMSEMLHLKTGLSYLEGNRLLAAGEFLQHPVFAGFNRIPIDLQDAYSANCIYVNGTVLIPAGYPATRAKIEAAGLPVIEVEVSEYRKLDGGLSCLSLRF
ncbi:MAG: dimethylarginine dimethylaminohydrolase family protein [Chloroflexota bacterium]